MLIVTGASEESTSNSMNIDIISERTSQLNMKQREYRRPTKSRLNRTTSLRRSSRKSSVVKRLFESKENYMEGDEKITSPIATVFKTEEMQEPWKWIDLKVLDIPASLEVIQANKSEENDNCEIALQFFVERKGERVVLCSIIEPQKYNIPSSFQWLTPALMILDRSEIYMNSKSSSGLKLFRIDGACNLKEFREKLNKDYKLCISRQ